MDLGASLTSAAIGQPNQTKSEMTNVLVEILHSLISGSYTEVACLGSEQESLVQQTFLLTNFPPEMVLHQNLP